jgi:hypothetical protein
MDGRPLDLDPNAQSSDQSLPAFLARPDGAPLYHGFHLVDDVEYEGFKLGSITSFAEGAREGDAFICAPDDSRAGLVWSVSDVSHLSEILPYEEARWGVWNISFPCEVDSSDGVQRVLSDIVPRLRPHWEAWREGRIHG